MRINAEDAPKIHADYEGLEKREREKAQKEQLIFGEAYFGKLGFPEYRSVCHRYGETGKEDEKAYKKWLKEYAENQKKRDKKYAEEHDVSLPYVRYKKKTDTNFLLLFAKNPTRETIHQTYAIETIKQNLPYFSSFRALPAGGKNALYIISGEISGQEARKKTKRAVKSIDAEGILNVAGKEIRIYFSLKYTKDAGGAQDNQYGDLIAFLKEGAKSEEKDVFFIAIADGEYYRKRETKYAEKEESRLEYLNSAFGPRCRAASLETLEGAIIEIIIESLEGQEESEENEELKKELKKRLKSLEREGWRNDPLFFVKKSERMLKGRDHSAY